MEGRELQVIEVPLEVLEDLEIQEQLEWLDQEELTV